MGYYRHRYKKSPKVYAAVMAQIAILECCRGPKEVSVFAAKLARKIAQ